MIVRVKFLAYFRDIFETKEQEVDLSDKARLRELLVLLGDSSDRRNQLLAGKDKLHPQVVFLINGTPAQSVGGLDARLRDGDLVAIFPFLGGG